MDKNFTRIWLNLFDIIKTNVYEQILEQMEKISLPKSKCKLNCNVENEYIKNYFTSIT